MAIASFSRQKISARETAHRLLDIRFDDTIVLS
jgi:hypothetical protein